MIQMDESEKCRKGDSSEEGMLRRKERWRKWDVMRQMETGPARRRGPRLTLHRTKVLPQTWRQDASQKGPLLQTCSRSTKTRPKAEHSAPQRLPPLTSPDLGYLTKLV